MARSLRICGKLVIPMKHVFLGSTGLVAPSGYDRLPGLRRVIVTNTVAEQLGRAGYILSPYQAEKYAELHGAFANLDMSLDATALSTDDVIETFRPVTAMAA